MCAETLTWHHADMFTIDKSTDRLWAFLSEKIAKRSKPIALACCDCSETTVDWSFHNSDANVSQPPLHNHWSTMPINLTMNFFLHFSIGWEPMDMLSALSEHSTSDIDLVSHKSNTGEIKTFLPLRQRLQDYNAQNDIEIPCKYSRRSPLKEKLFLLSSSCSASQAWNLCCSYRISGGSASSFYLLSTLRDFMPREEKH